MGRIQIATLRLASGSDRMCPEEKGEEERERETETEKETEGQSTSLIYSPLNLLCSETEFQTVSSHQSEYISLRRFNYTAPLAGERKSVCVCVRVCKCVCVWDGEGA